MKSEKRDVLRGAERLKGRVAVVTGAGHGIGKAYARRLAHEGAHVVIAEIDDAAARIVTEGLISEGYDATAIQTDVTDPESIASTANRTMESFGRIDILVNNAAMFATVPMSRAAFEEIAPDEWERMMRVNLEGPWLACRAVAPQMRKQRYGKIINISSGTALKGSQGRIHYVTSKAGIMGFTRTLARELGRDGITVNCVAPGSTLSEEEPDQDTVSLREAAAAGRAIPRTQRPEDIVGAVVFFASPDSDFVTGQTLVVDGGSHMH